MKKVVLLFGLMAIVAYLDYYQYYLHTKAIENKKLLIQTAKAINDKVNDCQLYGLDEHECINRIEDYLYYTLSPEGNVTIQNSDGNNIITYYNVLPRHKGRMSVVLPEPYTQLETYDWKMNIEIPTFPPALQTIFHALTGSFFDPNVSKKRAIGEGWEYWINKKLYNKSFYPSIILVIYLFYIIYSFFISSKRLSNIKFHNPRKLSEILKLFSSDQYLKYTNHPWDGDLDYDNFIKEAKKAWEGIKNDLKVLSPTLHAQIEDFLFSEKDEVIGFSTPFVTNELKNGKKPDEIVFDDRKTMQDKMNEFKAKIVVKQNDKKLKLLKIFTALRKELKLHITLNLNDLKKDEIDKFFTDVDRFKNALRIILKDIDTYADEEKKVVKILTGESNEFIEVRIIHTDSKSSKSAEQLKQTIVKNGGNFKTIYDSLASVCDWSVDTICKDGSRYKIDFLYPEIDSDKPHLQKIDDSIEGFTHILRFYK